MKHQGPTIAKLSPKTILPKNTYNSTFKQQNYYTSFDQTENNNLTHVLLAYFLIIKSISIKEKDASHVLSS